jgi:hypothetical protein
VKAPDILYHQCAKASYPLRSNQMRGNIMDSFDVARKSFGIVYRKSVIVSFLRSLSTLETKLHFVRLHKLSAPL